MDNEQRDEQPDDQYDAELDAQHDDEYDESARRQHLLRVAITAVSAVLVVVFAVPLAQGDAGEYGANWLFFVGTAGIFIASVVIWVRRAKSVRRAIGARRATTAQRETPARKR